MMRWTHIEGVVANNLLDYIIVHNTDITWR